MAPFEALIDNDIIIAMANYDLATEFDTITRGKCGRPHRCVPAARGSLRLSQAALWHRYVSEDARSRARIFFNACKPVPATPVDARQFADLLKIQGIDDGEAALIDYAVANPQAIIITGDKTSTSALAAACSQFPSIVGSLKGRVVHLECLIESMCGRFGWAGVRNKVCAVPSADKKIENLVGSIHSEATAKDNLSKQLLELEGSLIGMLLSPF